jgi:hypothetical protein
MSQQPDKIKFQSTSFATKSKKALAKDELLNYWPICPCYSTLPVKMIPLKA